LLVSTDLHGNGEDFAALRARFLELRAHDPDTRWLLLGDLVHGPDVQAGIDQPELYLYDDCSWEIVEGVIALQRQHPGQVQLLLGNHDWAHVGGPPVAKFYPDEAAQLEAGLTPEQVGALRALFAAAPLFAVAPCGLLLAHGSPHHEAFDLSLLDGISLDRADNSPEQNAALRSLLTSYGQQGEVTAELLSRVGAQVGFPLQVVVHGHDRDEAGWFAEGGNQLCPVLFGALPDEKRYLQVDLGARYLDAAALRDGHELRRLHR